MASLSNYEIFCETRESTEIFLLIFSVFYYSFDYLIMDISLTEADRSFYDKLFNLVDVEKIGKLSKLKSEEFLRTTEIEDDILLKVSESQCTQLDGQISL